MKVHLSAKSSFTTYFRVCNQINTTGVTSGEGTAYPSGALEFTPGFQWGSCYSIFRFTCMFCRSLFVLLYFFIWPLCCLFFLDIQIQTLLIIVQCSVSVRRVMLSILLYCMTSAYPEYTLDFVFVDFVLFNVQISVQGFAGHHFSFWPPLHHLLQLTASGFRFEV